MKSILMVIVLLMSGLSFAETLKSRKTKQEMLNRAEFMISKISQARQALDKENVATACKMIEDLFKIYPDHLVAVGTKMNLFDGSVIKMESESKMHLIYLHQQKNVCESDQKGENLELKEVKRKLKSMGKQLEKQKKKIKKLNTEYENSYNYYYEFN